MTGMDDGWDDWYGEGYNQLSPSQKQHIDHLKEKEKEKRDKQTRGHYAPYYISLYKKKYK